MPFDPSRHHRRSVRLRDHDYAAGLYFITVCTYRRQMLFGEVVSGGMVLSDAGQIVREEWLRTLEMRDSVAPDAFVVMPDHVHLLFGITGADGKGVLDEGVLDEGVLDEGVLRHAPTVGQRGFVSSSDDVAAAIRGYKGAVTRRVCDRMGREVGRVWQRGYHDRVVRTDREADIIRRYIQENPMRWTNGRDRADGHRA